MTRVGKLARSIQLYAMVVVLVLSCVVPLGLSGHAWAAGDPELVGGSAVSGVTNTQIPITDLQVSGTGADSTSVRLFVTHGSLSMTTTTGLTFTGSSTGATLFFTGTINNVNAALATLRYIRTSGTGTDTLEATLVGAGEIYFPDNGHLYEVVSSNQVWSNARALAEARTKYGVSGYLVTITSAAENAFVAARLNNAGWMGAWDAPVENDWQWTTGPESGTSFWSGLANGSAVSGRYENWATGEPNNSGNEDCAQFLSGSSGEWNDLPCSSFPLPYYVVEYGSPGNNPDISSANVGITVTGPIEEIDSCSELQTVGSNASNRFDTLRLTQDIDCAGIDFIPLFDGTTFDGVFDGQGHTISNLDIESNSATYVGLFGRTNGATLKDVTLKDGSVTGNLAVGGLVGRATHTTIQDVTSNLQVTGTNSEIGGLVGGLYVTSASASITGSSSTGSVEGGQELGGLVGKVSAANGGNIVIERSFATGMVYTTTGDDVGGLIGHVTNTTSANPISVTIQDTYAWGDVTSGVDNGGGLIGSMQSSSSVSSVAARLIVQRSYGAGEVFAVDSAGGLVGEIAGVNNGDSVIELKDTFAVGQVDSDGSAGGLVGSYTAGSSAITASGNYFDQARSRQTTCKGGGALSGCAAVNATRNQMTYFKNNTSNAPLSAWNFTSPWVSNQNNYPTFSPAGSLNTDEDNVTDAEEDAAPNSGDANGDGLIDSQQDSVTSLPNSVTGAYAVLEVSTDCEAQSASVTTESSKQQTDPGYEYPAGLMGFRLACMSLGQTIQITQYYYGTFSGSFVGRKYHDGNHSYQALPGAVITNETINGNAVTKLAYSIQDGGPLDEDGSANGEIVDPAGLALGVVGVPNTGLGQGQ